MHTPSCIRPLRGGTERGFVLIGVVMFVLALTILGLSLFNLSSFEAQFLGGSIDDTRAFHAAAGGIERAKFALAATDSLRSVQYNLPPDVTYSVAVQYRDTGADSMGTMTWEGDPVLIRVMGQHGRARHMLETRFTPTRPDNYYKRLITAHDGVHVNVNGGVGTNPGVRITQTWLNGNAWQSVNGPGDLAWNAAPTVYAPRDVDIRSIPVPNVSGYITSHTPDAQPPYVYTDPASGSEHYVLTGGSGDVRYFLTTGDDPEDNRFSVFSGNSTPQIDVTGAGVAVWMVEHGMRFEHRTIVNGTTNDCLIIVAPPNGRYVGYDTIGPWFFGGIHSPIVPVILVSNGEVRVEAFNNWQESTRIGYLSVFANKAFFMGPSVDASVVPKPTMNLYHAPGASEDIHGGLIDRLCELEALPNCGTGLTAQFPRISGAWQDLDPNNPPPIPDTP